ncbi:MULTISPECIES: hypothetical protein [Planococcus]|uniref:hypothetical protein n=1 Tax=Planococcus TaxID=1372 RepID=UPI00115D304C|nr:hypothetical protein [Planococcus soli]
MKKALLIIFLGVGIIATFYASNFFNTTTNRSDELERYETHDVLVRTYEEVEELEKVSDLVVSVKSTGDKKNHLEMDEEEKYPLYYWTESDFRIQETFKNTLSAEVPEVITVNEPYAFIDENEVLISEGYEITEEDTTYLLFLKKKENEEKYLPIGVYHGKFDMTSNDDSARKIEDPFEKEHPDFVKLKTSVKEKYMDKKQ